MVAAAETPATLKLERRTPCRGFYPKSNLFMFYQLKHGVTLDAKTANNLKNSANSYNFDALIELVAKIEHPEEMVEDLLGLYFDYVDMAIRDEDRVHDADQLFALQCVITAFRRMIKDSDGRYFKISCVDEK